MFAVTFTENTDILVMMDSSSSVGMKNFEHGKTFVSRLAERFLGAKSGVTVRVAVGQYSKAARIEQGLTAKLDDVLSRVTSAVFQNDETNVLEAMELAIRSLTRDPSRAKKKLVLFSDGRSQGLTEAVLQKRVREVADGGVELFVIAAGSQVNDANLRTLVSRGRLEDIAYGQRHLFRIADYASLLRGVYYQTVSRRVSLP